jgi:hypothetical protein
MRTENYLFILILALISYNTILSAQITFSEIMFDVSTNEYHDEFIEIFNLSYIDSVDISGWSFSDGSGVDDILPHRGGTKIPPRRFALILDGSYFENSMTYDSLLSDTLMVLKIGDNSFGKNGLSNSVAEQLTIRDSLDNIVVEHRYTVGNKPGYSDEKIHLDDLSDSLNWSDSKREGGTPGSKNSVSPPVYDFGFDENSFIFPVVLRSNETIWFSLDLYQYSTKLINDSIDILVFSDLNMDGIYQAEDMLIARQEVSALTQTVVLEWPFPAAGEHHIVAILYFEKDEVPENNFISTTIRILEQEISLHINEIKFLTEKDEPEWIELVNLGKEPIFLKDWAIADLSDTALINSKTYLKPGGYIVLSEDTLSELYQLEKENLIILDKFPTLNDSEDEIQLLNPTKGWVERIRYSIKWLEGEDFKLSSLERINPRLYENRAENWGPCVTVNGATPAEKNSIFSELKTGEVEISASPNPFSPDYDGYDDVTIISGRIPETNARIKAEIYDVRGRLIRTLKDNNFSGSHFNLVWDGRGNRGTLARIGIYIIYIQALNDRKGVLKEMKTTVILAQKL